MWRKRHKKGRRGKGRELANKLDREPSRCEVFIDTHTRRKVNPDILISNEANAILERCKRIYRDLGVDISHNLSIQHWVDAVGGARKNMIIGVPRTRASDLLGTSRSRQRDEGSSGMSTMSHIQDQLLLQAVDRTIAYARDNPDAFNLSQSHVQVLAQGSLRGESQLPEDHPLQDQTMTTLVHVIVEVLNDIYSRDGPGRRKGKEVVDETNQNTRLQPDPPRSPPRGGPCIRDV